MIRKQLIILPYITIHQLPGVARNLSLLLATHSKVTVADIAWCFYKISKNHTNSIIVLVENRLDLIEKLKHIEKGEYKSVSIFSQNSQFKGNTAYLFTGGGCQFNGMGKDLYENEVIFREAIDECAQLALEHLSYDIREVLFSDENPNTTQLINRIDYMQMTLFAYEYAMYMLWTSFGVQATVVIGHSIGEIIASCIAGVFSLKDGVKLACMSGALVQDYTKKANMVVVQAKKDLVENYVQPFKKTVSVAVINSALQTVISGDSEDLKRLINILEKDGIETKTLKISHAFHSPLMQPALKKYKDLINSLDIFEPKLPLVSCITGNQIGEDVTTLDHWVRHLMGAVNFLDAYQSVDGLGVTTLIELGPAPVLLGIIDQYEIERDITSLSSSSDDELNSFYENLAQWIIEGGTFNEKKVFLPYKRTSLLLEFENAVEHFFKSQKVPDSNSVDSQYQDENSLDVDTVKLTLKQKVGEILNIEQINSISLDAPLKELGMNSLKAIKFAEQLSISFSKKIKVSQIFKYPTINNLSSFLIGQPVKKDQIKEEVHTDISLYEEKIQSLSIEELEKELEKEIRSLNI